GGPPVCRGLRTGGPGADRLDAGVRRGGCPDRRHVARRARRGRASLRRGRPRRRRRGARAGHLLLPCFGDERGRTGHRGDARAVHGRRCHAQRQRLRPRARLGRDRRPGFRGGRQVAGCRPRGDGINGYSTRSKQMGFQHGLSGLNAAARNLDVIGHNVANANTVGAKASRAEFGDVIAHAVYGIGAPFGGLGVQVERVAQQFSQGDLASTANPLDLAINGAGFFRLSDGGSITYSRNGQFHTDKDGYIVNSAGARLTGYPADANGVIQPGVPAELRMVTGASPPPAASSVEAVPNLHSRGEAKIATFDLIDPTTYNSPTSLRVYDAQGGDTTLAL